MANRLLLNKVTKTYGPRGTSSWISLLAAEARGTISTRPPFCIAHTELLTYHKEVVARGDVCVHGC